MKHTFKPGDNVEYVKKDHTGTRIIRTIFGQVVRVSRKRVVLSTFVGGKHYVKPANLKLFSPL